MTKPYDHHEATMRSWRRRMLGQDPKHPGAAPAHTDWPAVFGGFLVLLLIFAVGGLITKIAYIEFVHYPAQDRAIAACKAVPGQSWDFVYDQKHWHSNAPWARVVCQQGLAGLPPLPTGQAVEIDPHKYRLDVKP